MSYAPFKHHRRSIRLKRYDYAAAGAYFVTICLQGPDCLLGQIAEGQIRLTAAGEMIARHWLALPTRFSSVDLDAFIVMPNHLHGIIVIHDDPLVGEDLGPAPDADAEPSAAPARDTPSSDADAGRPTLGQIVGSFKSITTNAYSDGVRAHGWPSFHGRLWQRNYYEHIIRNDRALAAIRQYIHDNPANWAQDRLHPDASRR